MRIFTSSLVLYRREVAWACLGAILWFGILGYRSVNYVHSRTLTLLFVALIVVLVPFVPVMLRYFTRADTVELDTESIAFTIRKKAADSNGRKLRFAVADIATYQIEFPNHRFACLVLKLRSGSKHLFSFRRQKRLGVKNDTEMMLEEVHKYFAVHQIAFAPSFYASQKGAYSIVGLLVLLTIPFIVAVNVGKNVPVTILLSITLVGRVVSSGWRNGAFTDDGKSFRSLHLAQYGIALPVFEVVICIVTINMATGYLYSTVLLPIPYLTAVLQRWPESHLTIEQTKNY